MENHHEYYSSNLIPFGKEVALIGSDTNGAAPQRVYGLFIDAEIYEFGNEITEQYFVKAFLRPEGYKRGNLQQDCEWFMYADSAQDIDSLIGTVVNAAVMENYSKTLNGHHSSYRNNNQLEFSDDTTFECIDDLTCKIISKDGRVHVKFTDQEATVSSLNATLPSKSITVALDELKALRDWKDKTLRSMYDIIQQRKEAELEEVSTPGIR
jgi:hypothetical protein